MAIRIKPKNIVARRLIAIGTGVAVGIITFALTGHLSGVLAGITGFMLSFVAFAILLYVFDV